MCGQLPVAGRGTHGETAAMGIQKHPGPVRPLRKAPDARNTAKGVLAIHHTLGLDSRLVPLIENGTEQAHRQIRRRRHDLGPVSVEVAQYVPALAGVGRDAGLFNNIDGHDGLL